MSELLQLLLRGALAERGLVEQPLGGGIPLQSVHGEARREALLPDDHVGNASRMRDGSVVRASRLLCLLRICGDWNVSWDRQDVVQVLVAGNRCKFRPSRLIELGCRELWSKHLLNEEGVALAFDLVVDSRNGFLELTDLLVELFRCHLHRLTLQLLHDGLIDQRQQLFDECLVLRLRRLGQHEHVMLRLTSMSCA